MNPVMLFSLIATDPLSKRAIKRLLEKDGETTRPDKLLRAFAYGEDVDAEFKILLRLIDAGLKAFGNEEDELKEKLRDICWRRGFASVLRGITDFGIRKPFVPEAPFLVIWDLMYACNLRYKHCYSTTGKPWKDELSTEEALKAVDVIADAGVTALAFSGGEPLIRKDFFEIASTQQSEACLLLPR